MVAEATNNTEVILFFISEKANTETSKNGFDEGHEAVDGKATVAAKEPFLLCRRHGKGGYSDVQEECSGSHQRVLSFLTDLRKTVTFSAASVLEVGLVVTDVRPGTCDGKEEDGGDLIFCLTKDKFI
ncbi:Uncharacterised protein r2_g997 [Pycnogonum litorale]